MARNTKTVSAKSNGSKSAGKSNTPAVQVIDTKGGFEPSKAIDFQNIKSFKAIGPAEADKLLSGIRGRGRAIKIELFKIACGVLMHYETTGDWSRLYNIRRTVREVLGQSVANAFVDWVAKYSTVGNNGKSSDDDFRFIDTVKGEGMGAKRFNLSVIDNDTGQEVGAMHEPFWNMERVAGPKSAVDFAKLMTDFIARAERLLNERTGVDAKGNPVKDKTGHVVKVRHKHIDATTVNALKSFAAENRLLLQ